MKLPRGISIKTTFWDRAGSEQTIKINILYGLFSGAALLFSESTITGIFTGANVLASIIIGLSYNKWKKESWKPDEL